MDRVDYESLVIQDLANFYKNNELKLDPWYQRRSVWNLAQKGYLLNTLFVKKPVPTIYIRHYLDVESEKSIKEVVDGQQRMRSILGYLDDEFAARHPNHNAPVKYSALSPKERTELKMTKLSIGSLVNAEESDVIEIFGRLNSISKSLNAQEKRNAKFSGAMKQFCLEYAAKKVGFWRETSIFSATDISRMDEVQFISDLVLNLLSGLSDFSSAKLDNLYEQYDDLFDDEKKIQKRLDRIFSIIEKLTATAIKDTIFYRSPIFFSLLIVLDQKKGAIGSKKLEEQMKAIDALFNDASKHKAEDRAFYEACTASTQRIKSRRVRHEYLAKRIS
ncbi:DUF262 domain-containing protein [Noviherbaspirillum cavernae]|uniref:DUF262 domain-containing protein n=1 Tax=Noviherbaspirillum cavernae TaxID=2320862 RepID=A0A418X327_9BURK|nr:DUF262 domain-containing protein [Noviherbaspirillum cavernae]RJG06853.1 DUF262 domain-containing protein [Noviherbaspirillum cavernae]